MDQNAAGILSYIKLTLIETWKLIISLLPEKVQPFLLLITAKFTTLQEQATVVDDTATEASESESVKGDGVVEAE